MAMHCEWVPRTPKGQRPNEGGDSCSTQALTDKLVGLLIAVILSTHEVSSFLVSISKDSTPLMCRPPTIG